MKQGLPFILLNNTDENPVYRVLVQTPEELPAQDMGFDSIQYDENGIKEAINGLIGEYVYDDSQSNHSRIRNPTTNKKKFAQVVNAGYCPQYGGYTDWEIFDKEYVPLMEQALNSRNKGLPIKEGPSTEIKPKSGEKIGDNSLLLTEFEYNGINWDKNIRDKSTGVCSVVLNSLPDKIGGDKVTDETKIELTKDEYDELKKAQTDLGELKTKYDDGLQLYNKGKKLYEDLQKEESNLREQLLPVWTKQGELKEQMVNSILERVPEAEHDSMKEKLENKDFSELEDMMILNSIEMPTGDGGVLGGGKPPGNPTGDKKFDDPKRQAAYEAAQKLPKARRGAILKVKEE